jgi:hypothetical protein
VRAECERASKAGIGSWSRDSDSIGASLGYIGNEAELMQVVQIFRSRRGRAIEVAAKHELPADSGRGEERVGSKALKQLAR